MTKLRGLTRHLFAIAVVAIGLALAPAAASADPIVFTVVEGVVPGATNNTFDADQINLMYTASLTINPNGTFTANLVLTFTTYELSGVPQPNQIGSNSPAGEVLDPGDYGLYALMTVTGLAQSGANPNDVTQTLFDLDPLSASATFFLNPDQAAGGDVQILTANLINALGSNGSIRTVTATGQVVGGSLDLLFTNATTQNVGTTYLPDFTGLVLRTVFGGTFHQTSVVGPGGGSLTGPGDFEFEVQPVPEPASMTLLGIGLLGAGLAARRRRNSTAA